MTFFFVSVSHSSIYTSIYTSIHIIEETRIKLILNNNNKRLNVFLCLLKYLHRVNAKRTAFKRTDISIHSPNISCYEF